ncbi:hypothetical protein TWF481_002904 [Arthrobotrys musiformis]|uniref:Uncharacterized protein n=1 Tax=Arthrobotrys musiformis TaxID=47236 RepID=A0AAV9VTN3_9PEZI
MVMGMVMETVIWQPAKDFVTSTPDVSVDNICYNVENDLVEAMNTSLVEDGSNVSEELQKQLKKLELKVRYETIMDEMRRKRSRSPKQKVLRRLHKSIPKADRLLDPELGPGTPTKNVSFAPRMDVTVIDRGDEEDSGYPNAPKESKGVYALGKAFAALDLELEKNAENVELLDTKETNLEPLEPKKARTKAPPGPKRWTYRTRRTISTQFRPELGCLRRRRRMTRWT